MRSLLLFISLLLFLSSGTRAAGGSTQPPEHQAKPVATGVVGDYPVVMDIVYSPLRTGLLAEAKEAARRVLELDKNPDSSLRKLAEKVLSIEEKE